MRDKLELKKSQGSLSMAEITKALPPINPAIPSSSTTATYQFPPPLSTFTTRQYRQKRHQGGQFTFPQGHCQQQLFTSPQSLSILISTEGQYYSYALCQQQLNPSQITY